MAFAKNIKETVIGNYDRPRVSQQHNYATSDAERTKRNEK